MTSYPKTRCQVVCSFVIDLFLHRCSLLFFWSSFQVFTWVIKIWDVFLIQVLEMALLDFPGLLFFSTYTLLVLFWAEIYHQVSPFCSNHYLSIIVTLLQVIVFHLFIQARSLPIDKLRPSYLIINGVVYAIQVTCRILSCSYCA